MRTEIKKLIEKAIKELQEAKKLPNFVIPEIKVEHPEEKAYGDYATNIAMAVAKEAKKNPIEIAGILIFKLKSLGIKFFEKIEAAKPGFINFFISKEYLQRQVGKILKQKEKFGQLKMGKNQKVNVEFISANPTGALHVGNGRGAFFGDCLASVLTMAGYKVSREYYINDSRNSKQIQELGKTALGKGESYLTPYLKSLIVKLKPNLNKFKSETDAGYFLAQNILGDIRKFIQTKLKIKFDFWISEHNFFRQNNIKKVYALLKNKNLIYSKDNASWLDLSKFNQKDEVLIRENGQSTYFLSDITYHENKIERGFKKIINIWGADHQGHVPRTEKAMKILGYKGDFKVLITQIVSLKKGKISKRKGDVIDLEWLIDEVGLDAARFFYLMKSLDTQMEFDIDLAKERSAKSPVYYVQYAHARICSILKKSKKQSQKAKINYKLLIHPAELSLIKKLIEFPEIVEDTAGDYQIQRLPQYVTELATAFHRFYRDCKVNSEDKNLTRARLSLISATKVVLKNTLDLIGVSAPEKM